jgi:hypothetical protein
MNGYVNLDYFDLIGTTTDPEAELIKAVAMAGIIAGLGFDDVKSVTDRALDRHRDGEDYTDVILKTIYDLEPLCETETLLRAMKELSEVANKRLRGGFVGD